MKKNVQVRMGAAGVLVLTDADGNALGSQRRMTINDSEVRTPGVVMTTNEAKAVLDYLDDRMAGADYTPAMNAAIHALRAFSEQRAPNPLNFGELVTVTVDFIGRPVEFFPSLAASE